MMGRKLDRMLRGTYGALAVFTALAALTRFNHLRQLLSSPSTNGSPLLFELEFRRLSLAVAIAAAPLIALAGAATGLTDSFMRRWQCASCAFMVVGSALVLRPTAWPTTVGWIGYAPNTSVTYQLGHGGRPWTTSLGVTLLLVGMVGATVAALVVPRMNNGIWRRVVLAGCVLIVAIVVVVAQEGVTWGLLGGWRFVDRTHIGLSTIAVIGTLVVACQAWGRENLLQRVPFTTVAVIAAVVVVAIL